MKAIKLWKHPKNLNIYIKGFKMDVKKLLDKPGVSGQLLLKMAKMIDGIFVGACSDVNLK